jgi:hypothetical protein
VGLQFYMVLIYIFKWATDLGLVKIGKAYDADLRPFLNFDYIIFTLLNIGLLMVLAQLNEYN